MTDNRSPFEFALEAIKKGTSVIPVGKDKIPLISWKEFQEKPPTEDDVKKWWNSWPTANVGIVTGKVSGITVVDVEKGGDISRFPKTLTVRTGGGGWHLYYKYFPINNLARIFPLTDVRGDGGYVVGPTSTHSSGKKYETVQPISPIVAFPAELFGQVTKERSQWKDKMANPVLEGSRNNDFTSIVGGLLTKFPQDDWNSIVWPAVVSQNKGQPTPLPEHELRTIFNSVASRELIKRNTGGEIKDVHTEVNEEDIKVSITLEQSIVCFKVKNLVTNLLEATVITWIKKANGLTHEMPFYLKIKSDSNKEQWARVLAKAFDRKENKELYPWTILVSKASAEIERTAREHKQDFTVSETVAKQATWLIEPFIQEDQINTFFGLGSSGKTMLSLFFAVNLAKTGVNSLFIDYENDSSSWKDKIQKLTNEGQEHLFYFDSEQIPLAEQVDKIKEVVKRRNISLIIIDSASLATGESTSDEKSVIRLMSGLKLLKKTVLLIAHQRKNDGDSTPIGSIQFENQARNVWNFKSESDNDDNTIIHIACTHTKANNTYLRKHPIGYKVQFGETIKITPEDAISNFENKFSVLDQIKHKLNMEPGSSYTELADMLGMKKSTVSAYLSKGRDKGLFKSDGKRWFVGKDESIKKADQEYDNLSF